MNKDDKKFIIQVNLSNRDSLISMANILFSSALSYITIIIALYTALISLNNGFSDINIIIGVFLCLISVPYLRWSFVKYHQCMKNAKIFNKQYQKYYFELYPDLKNQLH
ncbi:hypothetical protein HYY69_03250 [Candidatus Woesearchaeota archaeon]|nr:hypothetical protein [Candidatus Woesearchaeota archaeon]